MEPCPSSGYPARTLPARTSVLSKMLLAWAVLDMDTLLGISSFPSRGGESLLGMTSFSSSSLDSVGTQLPGPVLSGMRLSKGSWMGEGGEETNAQHGLGRHPGQGTGTFRHAGQGTGKSASAMLLTEPCGPEAEISNNSLMMLSNPSLQLF